VLVKWPNDVVVEVDGALRKVAGILVEAVGSAKQTAVVVGVGVNVHTRSFPDELAPIATSVGLLSPPSPPDRATILVDVLVGLGRDLELVAARGLGLVHRRLVAADALRGRAVSTDDGERGTALGIEVDGRLAIDVGAGRVLRVVSGEVRVHPSP
jgi:BirA family biotin operon repressor/biotin-[acetyl-CoA-carboxylase] ligase